MFCPKCGAQLENNSGFCTNCGSPITINQTQPQPVEVAQPVEYAQPVEPVQNYAQPVEPIQNYNQPNQGYSQQSPVYGQPAQPYNPQPVVNSDVEALSKSTLIFGILAVAFAIFPYLNFLGIVFGAIGKNKANLFSQYTGTPVFGRAKAGAILSKVGFILGIVLSVILVITFIACIAGIVSNSTHSYYYY